ncbi:uncharacterized protein LOC115920352 [Strongylocentrotus purpuratus]|uniref:MADS-box domain-containing protein n=1 Tax=Strongylocentrotus purpuratus TaxID=7668 RepID=A0A7M7SU98_STRPU|nr:uncharacterized protein LOC115920352 [Strongylocentrotus purpuratus]
MHELTAQERESIVSRGSSSQTTTRMPQVNAKEKKVFVAKKLQVVEDSRRRCKARWNRVQSLFRKAHQLAELTRCQAFLYVKDEFSKTIYWGTSYALQLFQSKMDLLVVEGGKRVRSVNFVAPSSPEQSRGAVPCEALDIDRHLEGCLGSGTPREELMPSSTCESSQGSTNRSTPELTPCRAGQKSTPQKGTPSKTKIPQITIKEKKVFVDKKLQFREKSSLRFKSRCRRIKSIFKKAHALVELTKCQVFVYVKDEFSKTTYWGTSDALQLFQPMIHVDSLIKAEDKPIWTIKFVAPLEPDDESHGSDDTSNDELLISSSANESLAGSTSQTALATGQSSPESTPCRSPTNPFP